MKLLTVCVGDTFHPSVAVGDDVLDLVVAREVIALASDVPDRMTALLAGGADTLSLIARIVALVADPETREHLVSAAALVPFSKIILGPVVPDPDLVLSGSMNSHGHLNEMGDQPPSYPCAFHKVRSALSASGSAIVPPPGHGHMLDWEGELCLVIGARCHRVSVEEALDYVVGYTLMNDVSAREYVIPFVTAKGPAPTAQAWERNVLGKNYPTFSPIGPVIVTKDELSSPFTYHMETLVNGEIMQSSTQEDLVFGPAEMVSYFSQFYVFAPGDIISMGSPPGVGMARKPQVFLKEGDTVEVRVASIGSLINTVASEGVAQF
ncbi:fumarylacetoacetate hydrolase family protein [Pseudomonas sp. Z18(2022)]|uniref:fumarylacetoacetate hydrolase family protein n=1 Tax=Pseudomonas sp. Z18(2022) TaxID=2983410 RepID=UPI002E803F2F|nr:fumarylacetoacetate hydrolase family protein [Pseudomonas sp. Z18(2022)]